MSLQVLDGIDISSLLLAPTPPAPANRTTDGRFLFLWRNAPGNNVTRAAAASAAAPPPAHAPTLFAVKRGRYKAHSHRIAQLPGRLLVPSLRCLAVCCSMLCPALLQAHFFTSSATGGEAPVPHEPPLLFDVPPHSRA
jgi:hypothetical protein